MIERLRILLDRPLGRRSRLAVLALAAAVTIGFAALVTLSGGAGGRAGNKPGPAAAVTTPAPGPPQAGRPAARDHHHRRRPHPRQDPQDRPGSVEARRAGRELREHRALQHVPWSGDGVTIRLVGARTAKAVLSVTGPTLAVDHRVWGSFLRRHDDGGGAYLPRFRIAGGRHGR